MRTYPKKALTAFIFFEIVSTIVGVMIYMAAPFGHALNPQLLLSDVIFFFITYSFCLSVPTALIVNRLGKLSFAGAILIGFFACAFVIGIFIYGRGLETFSLFGFFHHFARYLLIFLPMSAISWVFWNALGNRTVKD